CSSCFLSSLPLFFTFFFFFFFNDTATTEIYTLSLHDALPILPHRPAAVQKKKARFLRPSSFFLGCAYSPTSDRKSTRLNSSHRCISYAVFCLKKKKNQKYEHTSQDKQHKPHRKF